MIEDKARVSRVPAWVNPGSVIGIILIAAVCVWWLKSCNYRARCGAHGVYSMVMFESFRLAAVEALERDGALPTTILVLFTPPGFATEKVPGVFDGYCCDFPTRSVKVGKITLDDVVRGKVTKEQVIEQGQIVNRDLEGWESFEMLGYLREDAAWRSGEPSLIVMWMAYPFGSQDPTFFVGFAGDARAAWVYTGKELLELVEQSDAIATRLGIDPAPPELRAWCRD